MKVFFYVIVVLLQPTLCSCGSDPQPNPTVHTDRPIKIEDFIDTLDYVAIAAHRGYHENVPENSIPSIQAAIELGIEFVELDVRLTLDGVPVLMHDATVNRTTTGSGTLSNLPYSAISGYFLEMPDGTDTEYKIPTLEQALRAAKGEIFVNIDWKQGSDVDPLEVIPKLVSAIEKTETAQQVVVFGYTRELTDELRKNEGILINPMCQSVADFNYYLSLDETPVLNMAQVVFSTNYLSDVSSANKISWRGLLGPVDDDFSVENYAKLDAALNIGPDLVQTDYPRELKEYLLENNYRKK